MMRAKIRAKRHTASHFNDGELVAGEAAVEIKEDSGMHYLLRLDQNGRVLADTCHASVEEAKRQAEFEYELDGGWGD